VNELSLEECWKRGLLRKIKSSKWLIAKSLQTAKRRLQDAKQSLVANIFNGAVFFAYMSMFHAAKAILFRDGVREKSHACVVVYLLEKYGKEGKIPLHLINSLNSLRIERHDIVYGFDFVASKEDAKVAIENAKEFLAVVEKMLK
jgi:uncharacterized protein (UPF0332 family)